MAKLFNMNIYFYEKNRRSPLRDFIRLPLYRNTKICVIAHGFVRFGLASVITLLNIT